ncbi:hypothetical protein ACIBIZ_52320 [Nonomuraea spiralis]|uniref:hypothetical protein n=1 Tax=Nonomuraea spiralis TaxID=46182 RepID=UPI0037AE3939
MRTEQLCGIDQDIAPDVGQDMTQHSWSSDAWPAIYQPMSAGGTLVVAGPMLGELAGLAAPGLHRPLAGRAGL